MRVLVFGAGVIGQVYAGRLATAGHDVTLVARGATYRALLGGGVRLTKDGQTTACPVNVADRLDPDTRFDAVLVAVRGDQVHDALPAVAQVQADAVVLMVNLADRAGDVLARLGPARSVLAFPGVGGERTPHGVRYHEIKQQRTTVGRSSGVEQPFVHALHAAGFAVDETDDMAGWLATHAVFIVGVGAAILAAEGDCSHLAADRAKVTQMVHAVGDGFRALQRADIAVIPSPLRVIFTRVPTVFSVPYWQSQIRGDVGTLSIAPHVRATADTEFPVLVDQVRGLVSRSGAPRLESLLVTAGY